MQHKVLYRERYGDDGREAVFVKSAGNNAAVGLWLTSKRVIFARRPRNIQSGTIDAAGSRFEN